MARKFHIKKGDLVKVIAGDLKNQEQNQGKVLSIDADTERAIVEGLNMVSRHTKPNAQEPKGGIVKKEAPIHVSNLMLIDPKTGEPTRVGRKKDEQGKSVRYAKKTGEII